MQSPRVSHAWENFATENLLDDDAVPVHYLLSFSPQNSGAANAEGRRANSRGVIMKRRESPVIDVKDTQPYWATVTTPAAGSKCVHPPPRIKKI